MKTKSSEFIMKSSVRVCVHSEWKESIESRKSRMLFTVGRTWSSKLIKINT